MPFVLILKNLMAHRLRTLLTVGSLAVAVFLICFLATVLTGLEAGVRSSASDRLIVQSAVSLFVDLPVSYQGKIDAVDGVARTCKLQWFGGIYREPSNFFAQFAVDADRFFETYPEVRLIEGSKEDLLRTKTGCVVGKTLMKRFPEWKVGGRVPIKGTIFPRLDGQPWEFEIVGVYESTSSNVDEQTLWFRFDYLDESLEAGAAGGPRGSGVFVVDVRDDADPVRVAAAVDDLFDLGPQRVKTTSEAEFQRQFVSMLGGVPTFLSSIGGGVLFAILLAVLNTMLLSARQRTREFGVLKALGFTNRVAFALLILEALVLCGVGGALGVGAAFGSQVVLGTMLSQVLPFYAIAPETAALGIALSLGIGLLAGVVPAWQVSRLRCVEAFRAEV